jgi:hypothetical protein
MKKNVFFVAILAVVLVFGVALIGCESLSDFATGYSYGYSSTSEEGLDYTFYNYSSYTVTAEDSTGSVSIAPGSSVRVHFNRSAPISNVSYSPADTVSSEISGTSVYFRDK